MKLLYLNQYFKFPDESGSTRGYDLASTFVKKGIDVILISATSDEKYNTGRHWTVIEREGLKVHYTYLPYDNSLSYSKRIIVFLKFLWRSSFRMLKIKADGVLATSTPLTIGIPALMKKWFGKTPFVFEVRDVWPETVIAIGAVKNKFLQKLLYGLEKIIYKNASAIIPLSPDMHQSIVSRFPQLKEKAAVVIPNISEINRFQQQKETISLEDFVGFKPRFSVLYAGTFGKVNGIDYVVSLAEETLKLDDKLVYILIGKGAEKKNIVELAKKKNVLNKNVFIMDPITKDELPLWYSSVSMGSSFVIDIKELWANSANKFFDTLAAAKPILINHEGWQAKAIREQNMGFVLPQPISEESASQFVKYTQDDDLQRHQQKNALRVAKESYSLEVATEKYLKIFASLK